MRALQDVEREAESLALLAYNLRVRINPNADDVAEQNLRQQYRHTMEKLGLLCWVLEKDTAKSFPKAVKAGDENAE